MGQRASCSGGGFLVVFRSGKWILQFCYTFLNRQNCKIPYGTAMWDSVPVAPVAASCLWTRTFALIERQSLQKTRTYKIIEYPILRRRGALWKTMFFQQTAMTNEF